MPGFDTQRRWEFQPHTKTDQVTTSGCMTSPLQLTHHSETGCHLCGHWLLSGNYPRKADGNLRSSETLPGQWSKTAWSDISPDSIIRMSEKCYTSDNINETEDYLVRGRTWRNSFSMDEIADSGLLTMMFVTVYYNYHHHHYHQKQNSFFHSVWQCGS
jgi:hypothetical protein